MCSAEIQQVYADGTLALQTRNLRYGKLGEGILVRVRSSLVKRTKNHFHSLPFGVSIIRGCNGAIWISPSASNSSDNNTVHTGGYAKNIESISLDVRKAIVRLSNCIQILNQLGLQIFDTSIVNIFDLSKSYEVHELIQPNVIKELGKLLQSHSEMNEAEAINSNNRNMIDLHLNEMNE